MQDFFFQENFRLIKNENQLAEKFIDGSFEIEDLPLEEYEGFIYTGRNSVTKKSGSLFLFQVFRPGLIEQNSETSKCTLRKMQLCSNTFINPGFRNIL